MPIEMLKAQAIVARTYAAYHRQLNAEQAVSPGGLHGPSAVPGPRGRRFAGVDGGARDRGPRAALGRRALPRLLPHGQRGLHGGSAGRVRAPPTCRRSSRCASSFASRVAPSRLAARRAPVRPGRALAEARHLGRARSSPSRCSSGASSLRVTYIAVRGHHGHGDAPGQRPPPARRLRHAQEHAVRRRRGRLDRALRRARLRPRGRARPVARQDHGRSRLRRVRRSSSTTTPAPRSPRCASGMSR